MVDQASNLNLAGAVSPANSASNALFTPETGRFMREVLEKALTHPEGVAPHWSAEAWAFLANMLVNDYLHGWNHAGQAELNRAEEAAQNARDLNPGLALAYHVSGLIYRARGKHDDAQAAFDEAVRLDPKFARAQAQKGNELVLRGLPKDALPCVDEAIRLSPHDAALGNFYWVKGRAHFFSGEYGEAASWLQKSVELQPTVWYSWLYLVSAYALKGETDNAAKILSQFEGNPQFGKYTLKDVKSYEQSNPNSNDVVVKARQKFHEGLTAAGIRTE